MWELITKAHAQTSGTLPNITTIVLPNSNFSDVGSVVAGAGVLIVELAGSLALIAMIYSGIMYMMAGGDASKAETAKKNLIWAIIGVAITFLAFIIIGWINNILTI